MSPTYGKSRVSGIVLACAEGPPTIKNAQDSKYCAYACLHWENLRSGNLRESTKRQYHKQPPTCKLILVPLRYGNFYENITKPNHNHHRRASSERRPYRNWSRPI